MDAGKQLKLNTFNWGIPKTNAGQPKTENTPTTDVTVALIGDGVDLSHPALHNKVLKVDSEFSGPTSGSEGTHAAGVIAGTTNLHSNYGAGTIDISPIKVFDGSEEYPTLSGTGSAAPVVSGMAAGLLAQNPNMTTDEVKAALQAKAAELGWQTNER